MFDVKGSLTISSVKTSSSFASQAEKTIGSAINAANKPIKLKIEADSTQVKKSMVDIKTLSDKAINPLKEATIKAEKATKRLNDQIVKTSNNSKKTNADLKKTDNIFEKLSSQANNMLTFTIVAGVFFQLTKAINSTISSIIRFEKDIVSVTKVMNVSTSEISTLKDSVKDLGVTFGFSLAEATNAAAVYAQQGKSMNEVVKLTEASLLLANVSILTTTESTEALTAIINQFGFAASESVKIIDSLNEVANKYAVTEADITEAIKRSGAAAEEAGVSFEKFSGFVAALQERTRRGGRVIGTALKTIFARLNTDKAVASLRQVGIESFDLDGNFTNLSDRIDKLAIRWSTLSNVQRVNIATAVAGKRRYSDFISLMSGYDTVLGATETALNAQGSAMIENEKIMGTLDKTIKSLKTTWDTFAISLGDAGITTTIGLVAKGFQGIATALSAIPPEIFTALLGGAAIAGVSKLGKSLFGQFKDFGSSRGGSASAANKRLEAESKSLTDSFRSLKTSVERVAKRMDITARKSIRNNGGALRAFGSSSVGLFAAGAATNFASRKLEESGVGGADALSGLGAGFNAAAISQVSGASEKISKSLKIGAGNFNLMVIAASSIVASTSSILNNLNKVSKFEFKSGGPLGFTIGSTLPSSEDTKKDLDKFKSSQKEVKEFFSKIKNELKGDFSAKQLTDAIEEFDKLAEKETGLLRYKKDFIAAIGSGEKFIKVLEGIERQRESMAKSKRESNEKTSLDEAFTDLTGGTPLNKAVDKIRGFSPLGNIVGRYFGSNFDKEEFQKRAASGSAVYTGNFKDANNQEELDKFYKQSLDLLKENFKGKGIDTTTGVGKFGFDTIADNIKKRFLAISKALESGLPDEEATRIGKIVSTYKDSLFRLNSAIEESGNAHKKYSEFINKTKDIIFGVAEGQSIKDSEKRIAVSSVAVSRLDAAGVLRKNILEPFQKEIERGLSSTGNIQSALGSSAAKDITRGAFADGKSLPLGSDLSNITGQILNNALDDAPIDLSKYADDSEYAKKINDSLGEFIGGAVDSTNIEDIKKIISSSAIALAGSSDKAKTFGDELKKAMERAEISEKSLAEAREASIAIIEKVAEFQNKLNDSYSSYIEKTKGLVSVNDKLLSLRIRQSKLDIDKPDSLSNSDVAFKETKKYNEKNNELIDDMLKKSREIYEKNKQSIEASFKEGTSQRYSKNKENMDMLISRETEYLKMRADGDEAAYNTLTQRISDIQNKINDSRASAKNRFLTTTEDLNRVKIDAGLIKSIVGEGVRDKNGKIKFTEQNRKDFQEQTRGLDRQSLAKSVERGANDWVEGPIKEFFIAVKEQLIEGSSEGVDLEQERIKIIEKQKTLNDKISRIYDEIHSKTILNIKDEENRIKKFDGLIDTFKVSFDNASKILQNTIDTFAANKEKADAAIFSGLTDKFQGFIDQMKDIKIKNEVTAKVNISLDGQISDVIKKAIEEESDGLEDRIGELISKGIRDYYKEKEGWKKLERDGVS